MKTRRPMRLQHPARRGLGGVTLLESLVVIGVLMILAALLLPALSRGRQAARATQCIDNLRQLGLAAELYWDDHDGRVFPYLQGATNGGMRYWFGWLKPGAEGDREYRPDQGALWPYLGAGSVELCPSLDYSSTLYKFKASSAAFGYGYNRHLGQHPTEISSLRQPSDTILMADAAQVNDFQSPASPEQPLLEEFYYVDADEGGGYPNSHFRHNGQANAVFCDGHVQRERPVAGSIDLRLPAQRVGRLRPEALRIH